MKKKIRFFVMLACLIFLGSCTHPVPTEDFAAPTTTAAATRAASGSQEKVPPHDPDFGDYWMLVTQPASNSDQTITTLALLLSGRKTAIVGYTTGKNTSLIERSDIMIEMDDGKGVSKLVSKVHVASIDHLDFWAWVFEPRKPGANQLTVIIQTGDDPSTTIKVPIAQFMGGPDSADERISRRIDAPCPQAFDEDGLRISFEGWYLPPLPAQPSPTATLPDGVSIDHKFSLRIESTSSKDVQFLYIQFFSNGDILGEVIH